MPQKPETVLKELKAKKFAPIYFLQGEEPFYIDQISDFIEINALNETERGFNQTIMYGKDINMLTILNNAKRFPMMAQRQVVIVKEAQEMNDWNNEKAKELFMAYCEKPLQSTVLVVCYKHKKIDSRTKLAKALDSKTTFIETKKMYDNQLPDWVSDWVAQRNFKINAKATIMISEYIGNDLNRIANEIDKLLINLKEGTEINEDIVTKYVGISKEFNTFELQEAIAKKNNYKANQIVHYFVANLKANPIIPVIALLFGFFTKILLVHKSPDKSKSGLASLLGVNPFFVDNYLQASNHYPLAKVIRIIEYLRQADLQSKGIDSTLSEGDILKELVFKILH